MGLSLYFDEHGSFSIIPPDPTEWTKYGMLSQRVSLKEHLKWDEVANLHDIIVKSDIWEGFPAIGYTLLSSELKGGDENQRIDMLYLRNDGALLPCEIKIGGSNMDSHGQLIRYIADLHYQKPDMNYLRKKHNQFLQKVTNAVSKQLHKEKFNDFITENKLNDKNIRTLPKTGILIDELFKPQLLKAVRYLNDMCGFAIRLIQIETFVDSKWDDSWTNFIYRIDFNDID